MVAKEITWFLSELLKWRVFTYEGQFLGNIVDFMANLSELNPVVTGLIITVYRKARYFLPWEEVEFLNSRVFRIRRGDTYQKLLPMLDRPGEMALREQLFDRQIVDIAGAKVVRVNDLLLQKKDTNLILVKVDVGLRGIMRRAGLQTILDKLVRWFLGYKLDDSLINWNLVQSVGSTDILQLKISQNRLVHLHPADLADIIENLDGPERERVLKALTVDVAAEVLEETTPNLQVSLIRNMPNEQASDILEQMSPDEAADILQGLDESQAQNILEDMEHEQAVQVACLLDHDENTAGGLMTTEFLVMLARQTVAEALEAIRVNSADLDIIYYVYIEDFDAHLIGVCNLRELLNANPAASLGSIMITRLVTIKLEEPQKDIVERFAKYGLRAIPVIDTQGRLHGVLRFKALLDAVAPYLGR